MFHIAEEASTPEIPPHLSATAADFLRRCFERSADTRPSARKLLRHPFLSGRSGEEESEEGGGSAMSAVSQSVRACKGGRGSVRTCPHSSLPPGVCCELL